MPEKLFPTDELTKRERVERALNLQPVDRVPLHDHLGYSPGVISLYTGREVSGFDYTVEDIGAVIRRTLDMCWPIGPPTGTERVTTPEGLVLQHDNWTTWIVSRPFSDVPGARDWLQRRTDQVRQSPFDPRAACVAYREEVSHLQALVGETVLCMFSSFGFCAGFYDLGLELFVYLYEESPQVFSDWVEVCAERELARAEAVADPNLSPVILIPEDFATKQGPIFSPQFLRRELLPHVQRLTEVWHRHGLKVLYHSDGNYKRMIPDLLACGVDGFYCLEPAVGMDVVELKRTWPQAVWAGGVDGVDLMERGTPEQVRTAVRRSILETDALHTGGLFVGTSSEINPPVQPENFRAMVEAVGELTNPDFSLTIGRECR